MSVGSAVDNGARKLKEKLVQAGADAPAEYGKRWRGSASIDSRLKANGHPAKPQRSLYSFGAVFAEVRVDEDIPIPRVRRVVAVYSAGRIINPTTAPIR